MIFDRLSRVVPTNHAGRYRLPNNAIRPPSSNARWDANDATNVAGVPDPTRFLRCRVESDRVHVSRASTSASVRCENSLISVMATVVLRVPRSYASSVQSPAAAEMHVWMRSPSACCFPERRSIAWPATRGTTHVWQMPMRQPNGIKAPDCSPASRSVVRTVDGDRLYPTSRT